MTRRNAKALAAGALAAVLAILCGIASIRPASSTGSPPAVAKVKAAPAPTSQPRGDAAPPAPLPGSTVHERDEEAEACRAAILEADHLAGEVADECRLHLAEDGLCFGPVPFEHENQPASQVANMQDLFAPCGLDDSQVRYECSENPCIALIDRGFLLQDGIECETLREFATRLPAIDEQLPPQGVWRDWTPLMNDTPSDPVDAMRAASRYGARAARAEELLSGGVGEVSESCARAQSAIVGLQSSDRCGTLRTYWRCSSSKVELPPGTAERYVSYAEALVEDLLDTCPAFAESNHVFDCSGVPCILLVDRVPNQQPGDVFCGRLFGSTVLHPDHFAVWMYRGVDPAVADRFTEEREVRYHVARAALEAQRAP